jgi:hypothetical protein
MPLQRTITLSHENVPDEKFQNFLRTEFLKCLIILFGDQTFFHIDQNEQIIHPKRIILLD